MKKIAFVINDMRIGGAERVLANLTMGFPKDWEIDIILSDASEIEYDYCGNIIDLGIIRKKNDNAVYYFLKVLLQRIKILRKLKKKKKYDACIGFADSANVANILSGNKYCKIITTIHSTLSEANRLKEYRYVVSPLAKLLYNFSDIVVAVSEGVRQDLIYNYRIKDSKIKTIYNGCDLDRIEAMKCEPLTIEEEKWTEGEFVVATMGRMDIPKGQWHLIRAFNGIVERMPDAKLLILGEGNCEAYLRKLSHDFKLDNNVIFCGFKKNPFRILQKCEVFVFPSIYEGFGNAIVEAMQCGLPIISTDFNTGAREIMAPKTDLTYKAKNRIEKAEYGLLTPVCNGIQYSAEDKMTLEEKYLQQAILFLKESKEDMEKYRIASLNRAKAFSMLQMVEKWKDIICEV